jgi:SAM-dependent methyltransferase
MNEKLPKDYDKSIADISDWNQISETYTQTIDSDDRIYQQFKVVLWETLGNLQGSDVVDLGCGNGWLSDAMFKAGARVWGVDGSSELLQRARKMFPDIEFTEYNLLYGLPATDRKFDRVVANMVLMDIPDIGPLISAVSKILKPKGRFIFTMPHPCFYHYKTRRDEKTGELYKGVTGYHQAEVWRIDTFGGHNHYHRSLTYYFDLLRQNSMAVTRLYEPEHIPGPTTPELEIFWRNIPFFILIEAAVLSNGR